MSTVFQLKKDFLQKKESRHFNFVALAATCVIKKSMFPVGELIQVSICFSEQPCQGNLGLLLKQDCNLEQVDSAIVLVSFFPSPTPFRNKNLGETNIPSLFRCLNSSLMAFDHVRQSILICGHFLDISFLNLCILKKLKTSVKITSHS